MGRFLNPDNTAFQTALNSEIYIDKTELLTYTNKVIGTKQAFICNSRPRRFGKSMAVDMLVAYYSRGCDSKKLFQNLKIAQNETFLRYLNQYDVISLNMQEFMSQCQSMDDMLSLLQRSVLWELLGEYPDYRYFDQNNLVLTMQDIYQNTKRPFIVIIDEWDVLIRDEANNQRVQEEYIKFLRGMFKGVEPTKYIALAYLTGILPIKKLKTQSALNNFTQFTMLSSSVLAPYVGFTQEEVISLCERFGHNYEEVKKWYDGYRLGQYHIYNPNAVVNLMLLGEFQSYWSQTGTYESIIPLINKNFDGLKTAVIAMISGDEVNVRTATFQNDMITFRNKDDVLTLLVHLGYLAYNQSRQTAYIPNEEIRMEFVDAVEDNKWSELIEFENQSEQLLEATLDKDAVAVAEYIGKIHTEYASTVQYNNENSLSSVLTIAYLSAMKYYFKPVRELPTGRGFADFVLIPKPEYATDYPALIIELKWNQNVQTAMKQIKDREYPQSILHYTGNMLLVGINYDKKSKEHECVIETYEKI